MNTQYIVSVDTTLGEQEQQKIVQQLNDIDVQVVNTMLPIGVIIIRPSNTASIAAAKKIKGVLAVEEDTEMRAL